ncbi:MAG: hypothetical protein M1484_04390 [Patescibacteria group bacterium]|nr:hypothetical protein [Patescibacteria group bacterium]MCL5432297.1 hypothetical protein [Patescibacteria group bacterium]
MMAGPLTKRLKEAQIRQQEQKAADRGDVTQLQQEANRRLAEEVERRAREKRNRPETKEG